MPLFNTYRCTKCSHTYEGILDICGRCGSVAARVGGIDQCLSSGRPPGYAGGRSTPHSARATDAVLEHNFKIMKISNCTHRDGVPHCTFNRKKPTGAYNSMPDWAGKQEPIRAYQGLGDMARNSGLAAMPQLRMEGQPWAPPAVHPTAQPGAPVGAGLSRAMRNNTVVVAREGKQ